MDIAIIATIIAAIAASTGLWNVYQNQKLHKQGQEIKVHVDGKLDAAIAESTATRRELDAVNLLVAAMTANHEGTISADVVWAAQKAIDAGAATEAVVKDAAEVSITTTTEHAEAIRDDKD